MKPMKWPVAWNRPLSKEEREILKRLECAPDGDGKSARVDALLQSSPEALPSVSSAGVSQERWREDRRKGVTRASIRQDAGFVEGDG
jgi:hypothetical protein